MSDGLTVPFALAAGLSGAIEATNIIVTAGLAEIAVGSIAMGLGGYLVAQSDAEHYLSENAREELEVIGLIISKVEKQRCRSGDSTLKEPYESQPVVQTYAKESGDSSDSAEIIE